MTYIIRQEKAGVISKDAFKMVMITEANFLIESLARYSLGSFSYWGNTIVCTCHIKTPDEEIKKYLAALERE